MKIEATKQEVTKMEGTKMKKLAVVMVVAWFAVALGADTLVGTRVKLPRDNDFFYYQAADGTPLGKVGVVDPNGNHDRYNTFYYMHDPRQGYVLYGLRSLLAPGQVRPGPRYNHWYYYRYVGSPRFYRPEDTRLVGYVLTGRYGNDIFLVNEQGREVRAGYETNKRYQTEYYDAQGRLLATSGVLDPNGQQPDLKRRYFYTPQGLGGYLLVDGRYDLDFVGVPHGFDRIGQFFFEESYFKFPFPWQPLAPGVVNYR